MIPNDYGKNILLAEESSVLSIKPLIKAINEQLKSALIQSEIECHGYQVEICESATGNGGKRYWFSCPLCSKRCGVLYKNPHNNALGCRKCLNVKYRKSVKKGMAEDLTVNQKKL